MGKRFRARPIVPFGFAMGLIVLWAIEPVVMPWISNEPLARALIALGMATGGSLVAYLILVLITRSWPRRDSADKD